MYILEFFLRRHAGNEAEIMLLQDLPIAVTGSVKEFTDTMKERK